MGYVGHFMIEGGVLAGKGMNGTMMMLLDILYTSSIIWEGIRE